MFGNVIPENITSTGRLACDFLIAGAFMQYPFIYMFNLYNFRDWHILEFADIQYHVNLPMKYFQVLMAYMWKRLEKIHREKRLAVFFYTCWLCILQQLQTIHYFLNASFGFLVSNIFNSAFGELCTRRKNQSLEDLRTRLGYFSEKKTNTLALKDTTLKWTALEVALRNFIFI